MTDLALNIVGGVAQNIFGDILSLGGGLESLVSKLGVLHGTHATPSVGVDTAAAESGLAGLVSKIPVVGEQMAGKLAGGFSAGSMVAMAGVATAIGVVIGKSIGEALDHEDATAHLQVQLGLTKDVAAHYGELAGSLYSKNFGDSFKGVEDAIVTVQHNIGAAFLPTEDVLKTITGEALRLADAFGISVSDSTFAVSRVLTNKLAPDAQSAMDLVTASLQKGLNKGGDLFSTIDKGSIQFTQFGLNGEQMMGMLSQAMDGGAKNTDAVSMALMRFHTNAVKDSKTTEQAFGQLGLAGHQMSEDIAAGGPRANAALATTLDHLRNMQDPVERDQASIALFGAKSAALGEALYKINPDTAVKALGDVTGAAKNMSDTLGDTAKSRIESFRRTIEESLVNFIGGPLLGSFETVNKWGGQLFGSAWEPVKTFLGWLAGTGGIVIAVIGGIALATWAWTAASAALTAATFPLSVTFMAVVAVIVIVVAAVIYAYQNFGWFRDIVNAVWEAIKIAFTVGVAVVINVFNFVVAAVQNTAAFFVAAFNVITAAVAAVASFITTTWNAIGAFFTMIFTFIANVATTVWNSIMNYFQRLFQAHRELIIQIFTAISDFFTAIWTGISNFFTAIWNGIAAFATMIWNGIAAFFTAAFNAYVALFTSIWNSVSLAFSTVWNAIAAFATMIWNSIVAFFTPAFNAFAAFFTAIWTGISGVFTTTWNAISSFATTIWGSISGFFTGAFNAFTAFCAGIWHGIVADFQSIWGTISGIAQNIWDGVKAVFKGGVNGAIDVIDWLKDKVNVVLNFLLIPLIPDIPKMEAGGIITYADGGTIGGGFMTDGPMAIVGEGDVNHPEYVIPTDPAHRPNALALYQSLGAQLMDGGGILGWIGNAASSVWGGVTSVADAIGGAISDAASWVGNAATGLVSSIMGAVRSMLPGGPMGDIGVHLAQNALDGIVKMIHGKQESNAAAATAVGVGTAAFLGSGDLMAWIAQAEALTGVGASWTAGLLTLIGRESGGNPNAINLTDCVPLDTMILTRRGWLKHDEVRVGDETIGYNRAHGCSEWTSITRVVHYADAPLTRIGNSRWHATTTGNHRWLSKPRIVVPKAVVEETPDGCPLCDWPIGTRRRGATTAGGLRIHMAKAHGARAIRNADTYATEPVFVTTDAISARDRLMLAAPARTDGTLDVTTREAAILGWIAGDGYVERDTYRPTMSISQSKPAMVAALHVLLSDVPHSLYIDERPTRMGKVAIGPRHVWRIEHNYAQDLLRRAGHPKHDAVAQVLSMSTDQRTAWLEAMIDADGHRAMKPGYTKPHVQITQTYGTVLDAITLAVYLAGYRPNVRDRDVSNPAWSPAADVFLNGPMVSGNFLGARDAGRGDVWCVTTESGTWTAREDDHVFLTGNSNAVAGHPSQGLMQTIPGTFAAYHQAGTSMNITDPVANIAAGINYIKARYGGINNVQQANSSMPPKGYANGGIITQPTFGLLGENGPEAILPLSRSQRTTDLLASVGLGGAGGSAGIEQRLDRLLVMLEQNGAGATIHVNDTSGDPQQTARSTVLQLRMR